MYLLIYIQTLAELRNQVIPDELVQVQADAARLAVGRQPRARGLQVLRHQALELVGVNLLGSELPLVNLARDILYEAPARGDVSFCGAGRGSKPCLLVALRLQLRHEDFVHGIEEDAFLRIARVRGLQFLEDLVVDRLRCGVPPRDVAPAVRVEPGGYEDVADEGEVCFRTGGIWRGRERSQGRLARQRIC